jgi:hypothetical protein
MLEGPLLGDSIGAELGLLDGEADGEALGESLRDALGVEDGLPLELSESDVVCPPVGLVDTLVLGTALVAFIDGDDETSEDGAVVSSVPLPTQNVFVSILPKSPPKNTSMPSRYPL